MQVGYSIGSRIEHEIHDFQKILSVPLRKKLSNWPISDSLYTLGDQTIQLKKLGGQVEELKDQYADSDDKPLIFIKLRILLEVIRQYDEYL